jgi:lipid-A-disaccharide synthase
MKLVIIAGEVSGDMHGAKLLHSLAANTDHLTVTGIGGDLMVAEGMRPIYHIRQMAFLGLGEVIRHLPFIRRVFKDVLKHIKEQKPDAVVLIDYPGFNLRLAKKVYQMGVPVIYYISPQLWAWGKRRVNKIKQYVNLMLVIFPFEVTFYRDYGIGATYVGHPLVDSHYNEVKPKIFDPQNRVLGLLPGSRKQELHKLLPNMIATAKELYQQKKIDQAIIARVDHLALAEYENYAKDLPFINIYSGPIARFYNQLDAALVSSGTATLETAYFKVPLVIVYKVGNITWQLGKRLVRLEGIGLANIVAGKEIAAELLQQEFTPERAANELAQFFEKEKNEKKRTELEIIRAKLGEPGASQRAAESIIQFVQKDHQSKSLS